MTSDSDDAPCVEPIKVKFDRSSTDSVEFNAFAAFCKLKLPGTKLIQTPLFCCILNLSVRF